VQLTEPAERTYGEGSLGSKYQGQQGPTPSRYWQNFS
jgi:dCTP deaminase